MCRDSFHLLARGEKQYLKVGMVDRERRAEETLDNGHHCLCHILLQGKIGMVTICSSVAHLKCKKEKKKKGKTSEQAQPHITSLSSFFACE